MATTVSNTTFSNVYKDDFKDSDNYHRILFNSGKALQARELTQMQTIIQKEVARFGRNIFKEGAPIEPGGITVNNLVEYIKLDTTEFSVSDLTNVIGLEFTVSAPDPAIKFQVIKVDAATGSDPATLYVKYTDTQAGTASSTPVRVGNSQVFTSGSVTLKSAVTGASGTGTEASIAGGSFFVKEHFVFANPQTIRLSKYSNTPDADIGFKIVEDVVTVDDDNALYDNQGDTPNLAAPGADRYRIKLVLANQADIDSDENFVPIFNVRNGLITNQVNSTAAYRGFNNVLAERTKEESGDYVLKNFIAKFDDLNDSNLTLNVSGGVAYVDGYRIEASPTKITVPKARETDTITDQSTQINYGSFVNVNVDSVSGMSNWYDKLFLKDNINGSGSTIGTARIRHYQRNGSLVRLYLFDIEMNAGSDFGEARSITDGTPGLYQNFSLEDGRAALKDTSKNNLLVPLPISRPTLNGVVDVSYTIQIERDIGAGASNALSSGITNGNWSNTSDYVLVYDSSTVDTGVIFTATGTQLNISNKANTSKAAKLFGYADVPASQLTQRTKTLVERTKTFTLPGAIESDGYGIRFLDIGHADIHKLQAIKITDSDGADISGNYTLDNGQRDNYYDNGRLIIDTNHQPANGDVFIKFNNFDHTDGQFFTAGSYDGAVAYENIPNYTTAAGTQLNLRNVIDFRPTADSNGNFTANRISLPYVGLPQPSDTISISSIEHYLPRRDKLVIRPIDQERTVGVGQVEVINGIPSLNPQEPATPPSSLELYKIAVPSYTLSDSDVITQIVDNRRYTMRDISQLEKRVNRLAELTTLSFLETNTANYTVTDSNGNIRVQTGFIADNFKDFTFTDIDNREYRASIDTNKNILYPAYTVENVRLTYDSNDAGQSNTVRRGDVVTLGYDHTSFLFQNTATKTENVNPFEVIVNTGHLELSPESDDWIEKDYTPVLVSGGDVKNIVGTRTVVTRNLFGDSWLGKAASIALAIYSVGAYAGFTTSIGGIIANSVGASGAVAFGIDAALTAANAADLFSDQPSVSISNDEVVVGAEFLSEEIGDRIVSVTAIPFMRSKKVYFRAQGLIPNTRYYAFFDDVDVADWVREESSFTRYSATEEEWSNLNRLATSHPDGSTNLVSDENGSIVGSFFIPSSPTIKFRTGSKIFKLLNITSSDEANATSYCQSIFTSAGVLENREKTIKVTRQINVERIVRKTKSILCFWDPLAQSFFVSQTENPNGIFVTKLDVFMHSKPSGNGQPLIAQLRTVTNGYPDPWPIPGAVAYLNPSQVNVPAAEDKNSMAVVRNTPTTFTFPEPVYLTPGQEYAIVLAAETTDYKAYVAETYEYILGSTDKRVVRQPTLGSLFKSQNSTLWEPAQNLDLMFRVWRADFDTSGTAILETVDPSKTLLGPNAILTDSSGNTITVRAEGHGLNFNDTVTISGLDSSSSIGGIANTDILGERTVTGVDHTGFTFDADSSSSFSSYGGGNNIVISRNIQFNQYIPSARGLVPNQTTLNSSIKLTRGSSYASGRNTSNTGAYGKDGTYANMELNEINITREPKIIPSAENRSNITGNAKPVTLKLELTTDDTKVSPMVDLQRSSMTCLENVIDYQDASITSGRNIPLNYVAETNASGGSAASKHITNIISVPETSYGLQILFSAFRPSDAEFEVYYRLASGEDDITNKAFSLATHNGVLPQADNTFTIREYDYLVGGQGGISNGFNTFQVKIVMNSTNTSNIPVIKNFRAIALAT